jgi:hypothetical protein
MIDSAVSKFVLYKAQKIISDVKEFATPLNVFLVVTWRLYITMSFSCVVL